MDTTNNSLPTGTPINDIECERTVLATLMSSYQSVIDTDNILDADCFYVTKHQEIWTAIHDVYKSGDTPDMVLVSAKLAANGSQLSNRDVMEICLGSAICLDLTQHALRLKELNLRRRMWEIGMNLASHSNNEVYSIEEVHNETKSKIDNIFEGLGNRYETLTESYRQLQERMLLNRELKDGQTLGTPTGFPILDSNGGLNGSDLIIVGAETSQGKTSFATALVVEAIKHGDGVAFYSMEMMPWQLAARIASMQSGIVSSRIMYNKLDIQEIYTIDASMEGIGMDKLYFDGRSTSSLESILMSIRQMKMKYGIKGAVIDYLQLVNVVGSKLNREQAVAHCARELKNVAKELNIWIIAISQLSRNNSSPIPTMSRLRDSGQIEEAADNIYLIYRPKENNRYPEPFQDMPTKGTAMITVGKGRNVGNTEFICGFKAENTLFYPLDEDKITQLKANFSFAPDPQDSLKEELPF